MRTRPSAHLETSGTRASEPSRGNAAPFPTKMLEFSNKFSVRPSDRACRLIGPGRWGRRLEAWKGHVEAAAAARHRVRASFRRAPSAGCLAERPAHGGWRPGLSVRSTGRRGPGHPSTERHRPRDARPPVLAASRTDPLHPDHRGRALSARAARSCCAGALASRQARTIGGPKPAPDCRAWSPRVRKSAQPGR